MRLRVPAFAAAIAAGAFLVTGSAAFADAPVATYEVTITNLTEGQPLTPPVVATHRAATSVFTVGQPASFELKEIAENGNLAPMIAALASDKHVADSSAASAPLVPAGLPGSAMFGDSVTLTVTASEGAKFLSFASMLICTNDGFTGVDSLRLPTHVGDGVTVRSAGYDAGTERNTEDFADIVPPCQGLVGVSSGEPGTGTSNPTLAEGGVIHHHPGIIGGADLVPGVHGWTDPVAEIAVERVG
jgi:Spondin_N